MQITALLKNEEKTLCLGKQLALVVPDSIIIGLSGELGAGKTTLVRGFLRALDYAGPVKSPTYALVEPYTFKNKTVYHFDLYRLSHPEELEYIGIRDYLTESICLIEWPERGKGVLPEMDLDGYLNPCKEGRMIKWVARSAQGKRLLRQGLQWG